MWKGHYKGQGGGEGIKIYEYSFHVYHIHYKHNSVYNNTAEVITESNYMRIHSHTYWLP